MSERLALYEGCGFLGGRGSAFRTRTRAQELLAHDAVSTVTLDFRSITGVSHSFADELLSPLSEMLGQDMERRVALVNCGDEVYADLESVAEMHGLWMPARRLTEYA